MMPGARQHGMAGSLTGTIDEMYAFYANPAATGFLREWQWSTTYSEWIADIYNLSFIYGRHIKTPWSAASRIAFGIHYQGIREFDSTNRTQAPASANDLLVTASVGNPLNSISRNLSVGLNIKYLQSQLADYSARSWILDFGLLYRSNRFNINTGVIKYGILSAGIAISQLGNALNFDASSTPLPRTFRAGAALNFGTHTGIQIQLSTDYQKVRDEIGRFSFGTEISWNYFLALRGGYNFNNNLLSKFSFGMSLRLDAHASLIKDILTGKNNALRIDVAGLEKSEFFSTSFRGGVNYYPIGPEKFGLVEPEFDQPIETDSVTFTWQSSRDPDLYDDVNYFLIIEKAEGAANSDNLAQLIKELKNNREDLFDTINSKKTSPFFIVKSGFKFSHQLNQVSYNYKQLSDGDYFWSVLAYDKDQHIRFSEKDGKQISQFRILPDLLITDIKFNHDKWITENEYQGELLITIKNNSNVRTLNNTLIICDSLLTQYTNSQNNHHSTDKLKLTFEPVLIPGLTPKSDTTIVVKWFTPWPGEHKIIATLYKSNQNYQSGQSKNRTWASFYTIPKGFFKTEEKVVVAIDSVYEYELPFIPKIFFEHNSAEIKFKKSALMYSPLDILVKRLKRHPTIKLKLQGYADATNGESGDIAYARARAIKDFFHQHGIPENQIEIPQTVESEQIIKNLNPRLQPDRKWVQNERRYVKITAHRIGDETEELADLFHSVPLVLPKSTYYQPVKFKSNIKSFVPLIQTQLVIQSDTLIAQKDQIQFSETFLDSVSWRPDRNIRQWINSDANYSVMLKDTLERVFYTKEQMTRLISVKNNLLPNKIIVGVAEFKKDKPSSNMYWLNVLDKVKSRLDNYENLRLQFIGHACAIGSPVVNESLSLKRARKFQNEFLYELENHDPDLLKRIEIRLDKYTGRGESEPFHIEIEKNNFLLALKNKNYDDYLLIKNEIDRGEKNIKFYPFKLELKNNKIKLISDNSTTFGRQMNRRIEILIKKPDEKELTLKNGAH